MRPQIALSCNHNPTWHNKGYNVLGPHFYLYSDYVRPLAELGAAPQIIPCLLNEDYYRDSLRNAQGFILVGGIDVNPFLFDKTPEWGLGKISPDMDYGEIEMTKIALEMNIPILAICRGIQMLNLVIGGTIHQHLPDNVPGSMKHLADFPPNSHVHYVDIEEDSLLHSIVGKTRLAVNSGHHQAVDNVGSDAVVTAKADDGVIEAIEMPGKKWVLGVQWHPEQLWRIDEDHKKIFEAFIKACS